MDFKNVIKNIEEIIDDLEDKTIELSYHYYDLKDPKADNDVYDLMVRCQNKLKRSIEILEETNSLNNIELSAANEKALYIIRSSFEKENIDFDDKIHIRDHYDYFSLALPDASNCYYNDFCKIRTGSLANWIALYVSGKANVIKTDERFSHISERSLNKRFWKIQLKQIDEIENYTDLIIKVYRCLIENETENKSENENKTTYNKGKNLTKERFPSDYVLFDLETTSKYVPYAKIIEIAAVKVRNNFIVEEFETLVNPQMHIPDDATMVNGISDSDVENAPVLSDVLEKFYKFIENETLVGHNINAYDINIISRECEELLGIKLKNDFVDTYQLARNMIENSSILNYKLITLCDYFGIDVKPNHRALQDVKANFELYNVLKKEAENMAFSSVRKVSPVQPTKLTDLHDLSFTVDVVNKKICLTGDFRKVSRNALKEHLKQMGAKVMSAVSSKTDYLLIGDLGTTTTHKIDDANNFGTKIIYEKDFIQEVLENV